MSNVKLKIKPGVTAVSCGGVEYKVDKRGHCVVPAEAVADLVEHGVVESAEDVADKEPAKQDETKQDEIKA